MYQQRESLWHKRYDDCHVIAHETIGHSDVKLTIREQDGTTHEIFADVLEVEDMPLDTGIFNFGVYRTHSEMLGQDIEALAWATYRPDFWRQLTD